MNSGANQHLNEIVNQLFDQAVKDGIITDEEYILIQSIEFEMDRYLEGLNFALEDGIITEMEKEKLIKLQKAIVAKAEHTAAADGIVDEDEKELLRVLKYVLTIYLS
ncbi:MAG: hypothetical protein INQ03_14685 [Candidatus Heimdallarchaeota archaeon]|nr:hypothetical protein [Candidatus Heimdallarchaeota archaeon]